MRYRASLSAFPAVFLVIALLAAGPVAGEAAPDEDTRGWGLRVSPTWIDASQRVGLVVGYEGDGAVRGFEANDVGVSIAGEYRLSPRFGVEVGLLATESLVGVRVREGVAVGAGTSTYYTLTVGPNVHLTPDHQADVFFGPFLAFTDRSDVGYHSERINGGFGWGAVLGVDIPVGERGWQVCPSVRYVDTNLDGTSGNGDRFDLDLSLTAVGVGFGYRW